MARDGRLVSLGPGWLYADLLLVLVIIGFVGSLASPVGPEVAEGSDGAASTTSEPAASSTIPQLTDGSGPGVGLLGLDRTYVDIPWNYSAGSESFRALLLAEMECLSDRIIGRTPGFVEVFNYSSNSSTSTDVINNELLMMEQFANLRATDVQGVGAIAYIDTGSDVKQPQCGFGPHAATSQFGYLRVFFESAPTLGSAGDE